MVTPVRRRALTLMSPMGSGCAASRKTIPAGGGAKPTTLPLVRAWRSIPNARCGCGVPIIFGGPRGEAASRAPQPRVGAGREFDETPQRSRLKLLNVIDEFTREALAIRVDHSIDADGVVETPCVNVV